MNKSRKVETQMNGKKTPDIQMNINENICILMPDLSRLCPTPPPPPSLVGAYYLHPPPPGARAIFLHNDLGSFPYVPLQYVMPPPPPLQSTCHYIANHYVKIWHMRLGGANNMCPLSCGGGGGTNGKGP